MTAAEARKVVPSSATPAPAPTPTTDTPTPTPDSPTPTPTSSPVTITPSDEWTPVPDGKGGTALLRTVKVKGGTARFRFAENDVKVLATEPAEGFTGNFDQQSPGIAVVTFTSGDHVSKLTAFWDRIAKVQVSEQPAVS